MNTGLAVALSKLALTALLALSVANTQAQTVHRPKTTDEARDVVRALRSIEARTSSGLTVAEYSREVGDLQIAAVALDELLERRGENAVRAQLVNAVTPWQDAKDVWSACVRPRECGYKIIALGLTDDAGTQLAKGLLAKYPAMNRLESQGGVLMDERAGNNPGRIYYPALLSALWSVGKERARELRARLQPAQ